MLRAFFLIFILVTIAWLAVFGFRGQKSSKPEIEIFPDMVRQMKVRAQSESNFFADQRGGRKPVDGTVPIGYDMPMPNDAGAPVDQAGGNGDASASRFQRRDRLLQHGQDGPELGHRHPAGSDPRPDESW
jgi:hypothetical protein